MTIYSVTSFTVSRRTREIGVRVALGGSAPRVVGEILRRPLVRVVVGIALGVFLTALLSDSLAEPTLAGTLIIAAYAALATAVCATACVVPTRKALAVDPTEALGVDG